MTPIHEQPRTHGGKREGAGRPKKEPTVTISFRVPVSRLDEVKTQMSTFLKKVLQVSK